MNRIKMSPLAIANEVDGQQDSPSSGNGLFTVAPSARRSNSASFVPMHYEKNYAYPLVVWLHSDGQRGAELHDVMPKISVRNYVAVAPELNGQGWSQDGASIEAAHEAVVDAIEMAAERFNVHSQKIFLAGVGGGGTMAFRLGLERPGAFAGALSLGGPFPQQDAPLSQWGACQSLPLFLAQHRDSQRYSENQLCEQLRLMHIAGFALTLRQYPGGDGLTSTLLADVNRWMMELVNSPSSADRRHAK